jgi:hypothetical protein
MTSFENPPPQKKGKVAPLETQPSESGPEMTRHPNGPRHRASDLGDPVAAHDALVHWDELDDQLLKLLDGDSEHGRSLALLQQADAWLRARAAESVEKVAGKAPLVCPAADELYDFGGGPGSTPLTRERQEEIDRHLSTCLACEQLVATLESTPPLPLILGEPEILEVLEPEVPESEPVPLAAPVSIPRALPARPKPLWARTYAWAAAAAAILLTFTLWRALDPAPAFPRDPILRGESGGPLYFPRERLLVRTPALTAAWPALRVGPLFEVEPQPEALEYVHEVRAHAGGAFESGALAARWSSPEPTSTNELRLSVGHYSWQCTARIRGLDQPLGARDFEVVSDPPLENKLIELARGGSENDMLRAVGLLHELGYRSDARDLARALPPSFERDQYLETVPAR